MRTRMAPSYVNLFMANLEKDLMAMNSTSLVTIYWQHVRHLVTWPGISWTLPSMDQSHTTIKFMAESSTECVTFLDTTVMLENDMLHTDLYTKPLTPTSTYHPIVVVPDTAPTSEESAQEERTLWKDQVSWEITCWAMAMKQIQSTTKSRAVPSCSVHKPYIPAHSNNNHAMCPW